eukprot:7280275-Heterocapsa_arctica.AAC.1
MMTGLQPCAVVWASLACFTRTLTMVLALCLTTLTPALTWHLLLLPLPVIMILTFPPWEMFENEFLGIWILRIPAAYSSDRG